MYNIAVKILFLALSLLISTSTSAKEDVEFYIYFDKPPFIIDKEKHTGLSYDFVAAINKYSKKFHYSVSYVPKQRAIYFAQAYSGLLWTNPHWVDDSEQVKYAWINDLIFDRESYITNDPNLTYVGVESLYGKRVAGVRGFTYFNLESAFNQKKITRIDVHNEKVIPLMLINKRADVGVIGLQTFEYFKRTMPEIKEKLHILHGYNKEFTRSILIDKLKPELKQDIEEWLSSTQGQKDWLMLKEKWLHDINLVNE